MDENYVKQLEQRIEYYERICGALSDPFQSLTLPNGDLDFLKEVCGYQPAEQPCGLGSVLRSRNGQLSIDQLQFSKADSVWAVKDHVVGMIAKHCEHIRVTDVFDLLRISNEIHASTQRGLGNVIWCNKGISDKIEAMESFDKIKSRITVICDESMLFDIGIMVYKGTKELDCGLTFHSWGDGSVVIGAQLGWDAFYRVLRFS